MPVDSDPDAWRDDFRPDRFATGTADSITVDALARASELDDNSRGPDTDADEVLAEPPRRPGYLGESARIGRYAVLRQLGEGGMGVVYSAYDEELDRRVALKLLRPGRDNSPANQARMQREARAMARLSHPNVVQVYEVGRWEQQVYLAMEFVQGKTLGAWLKAAARSWQTILDVMMQAGLGLSAAHEADIVHGDFKPDNILIDEQNHARVVDFGLARAAPRSGPHPTARHRALPGLESSQAPSPLDSADPAATRRAPLPSAADTDATRRAPLPSAADTDVAGRAHLPSAADPDATPLPVAAATPAPATPDAFSTPVGSSGGVLESGLRAPDSGFRPVEPARTHPRIAGTPAYMAAEQHAGRQADARTDQFSFAVTLYTALYGHHPFAGGSLLELVINVTDGKIRPPPADSPVPPKVYAAILRALAHDPEDRFASMRELLDALDRGSGRARDPEFDLSVARPQRVLLSVIIPASIVAITIVLIVNTPDGGLLPSPAYNTIAGFVIAVVLYGLIFAFRASFFRNTINRRVVAWLVVSSLAMLMHRTTALVLGTSVATTMANDLMMLGAVAAMAGATIERWIWFAAGVMLAGALLCVLFPGVSSLILVASLVAVFLLAYRFWSR